MTDLSPHREKIYLKYIIVVNGDNMTQSYNILYIFLSLYFSSIILFCTKPHFSSVYLLFS